MSNTPPFSVKDLSLAEQGFKNIEWAERQMGALLKVRERFAREKPLAGLKIGIALHVTKETAVLVRTLIAGGADVAICSCNPLSTQDDVAAALAKEGVRVYAKKGLTHEEYYENLRQVIDFKPQITIDDGCDLVSEIHTNHPQLIPQILFGNEETTTGIIRLKAMEKDGALKYPVLAINDLQTKHLFDNFYGTGASTLDGITRATNLLLAGKNVVVCGYGPCGKGVALRAKGMGANVIVTEVNPFRALQATMDGYRLLPLLEAVKEGDVFITVTGNKNVIDLSHMKQMKDNAVLANSGHFDAEINMKGLKAAAKSQRKIRPFMDEFILDSGDNRDNGKEVNNGNKGKKIFVLGEGRLINLAAAEGHPSVVMAQSFCGQALAVEYGVKNQAKLKRGVNELPAEIDETIAKLQLAALGIKIDELTPEQKKYLASWQEGT
ncbi:MAG: adenosylhomocysteinase [Nanoarchaeota archaeon]